MLELFQVGHELVKLVADANGAVKTYQLGKNTYDYIRGFTGKKQMENAALLNQNTTEKLKDVDKGRLSEPSPSVLTPLLEAAIQESRTELQDIWASLLANILIDGGIKVRQEFVETVKQMDPADVLVFRIVGLPTPMDMQQGRNSRHDFHKREREAQRLSPDDWAVSVEKLVSLKCLYTAYGGQEPSLTPFGRLLLSACQVT